MVTSLSICATEREPEHRETHLLAIYSMHQLNIIWCPVEDVLLFFLLSLAERVINLEQTEDSMA